MVATQKIRGSGAKLLVAFIYSLFFFKQTTNPKIEDAIAETLRRLERDMREFDSELYSSFLATDTV